MLRTLWQTVSNADRRHQGQCGQARLGVFKEICRIESLLGRAADSIGLLRIWIPVWVVDALQCPVLIMTWWSNRERNEYIARSFAEPSLNEHAFVITSEQIGASPHVLRTWNLHVLQQAPDG